MTHCVCIYNKRRVVHIGPHDFFIQLWCSVSCFAWQTLWMIHINCLSYHTSPFYWTKKFLNWTKLINNDNESYNPYIEANCFIDSLFFFNDFWSSDGINEINHRVLPRGKLLLKILSKAKKSLKVFRIKKFSHDFCDLLPRGFCNEWRLTL